MRIRAGAIAMVFALLESSATAAERAPFALGKIDGQSVLEVSSRPDFSDLEYRDWSDGSAGITERGVDSACGVKVRARILRTGRADYLYFVAESPGPQDWVLASRQVTAVVERAEMTGPEDVLDPGRGDEISLIPGTRVVAAFPFRSKALLTEAMAIRAEIVLRNPWWKGDCRIRVGWSRLAVGSGRSSYRAGEPPKIELALEAGYYVATLGDLSAITSGGWELKFAAQWFPLQHHGLILGGGFAGLGGGIATGLLPATGNVSSGGPGLSGLDVFIGYTFRTYVFADRLRLSYALGPGVYLYSYNVASANPADTSAYSNTAFDFMGEQRLSADWIFYRGPTVEHGFGVVVTHDWLPAASLGPLPADGSIVSVMGRFLIGF